MFQRIEHLDRTIFSIVIPKNNIILEYYLPDSLLKELKTMKAWIGRRVFIRLSGKLVVGIILDVSSSPKTSVSKLQPILYLIDKDIILNEFFWKKLNWISRYYCSAISSIINNALPGDFLRLKKTKDNSVQIKSFLKDQKGEYALKNSKFIYEKDYIELVSEKMLAIKNSKIHSIKQGLLNNNVLEMNLEQSSVYNDYIVKILCKNDCTPVLLYGVPASGKTIVYLNLLKRIYQENKLPILILVPEVSLVSKIVKRVEEFTGLNCLVYHGELSIKEKFYVWTKVIKNEIQVICSTRSGIWLPFIELGGIIIDDEHDASYKNNYGSLRENARDIAIWIGREIRCFVLLCSSTPSLETMHNVHLGRYRQYKLLNKTVVSNNTNEVIFNKNSIISKFYIGNKKEEVIDFTYKAAIQRVLDSNKYVLIIINRRGFAEKLFCRECKSILKCQRCKFPYVVHQINIPRIRCIKCNIFHIMPNACPSCKSSSWIFIGIGVEKLHLAIKKEFQEYKVMCFSQDLTPRKASLEEKIDNFFKTNDRGGILIGTQMLSKGYDFQNIGLSILLNIDGAFFSQDLRADERFCQLYTQVLGRTSRNSSRSSIIVETQYEGHPILSILKKNGYIESIEYILAERKAAEIFPWKRLIYIYGFSIHIDLCKVVLEKIRAFIENFIKNYLAVHTNINIIGPYEVERYRKFNKNSFLLEITGENKELLAIKNLLYKYLNNLYYDRKVNILIEVDP